MATSVRGQMATAADLALALRNAPLEIVGYLVDSSNGAFVASVSDAGHQHQVVYKPLSGERPLWDFPNASLGRREVAAYQLAKFLGWHQVPVTVWRDDGPAGPGMCQLWVDGDEPDDFISLFTPDDVPSDWIAILAGSDAAGEPVALAHSSAECLQRLTIFDYLANNADRKAGHIIAHGLPTAREISAIDHGLTFHQEPKLRTVLWGFSGQPLPTAIRADLSDFLGEFPAFAQSVAEYLEPELIEAVRTRARIVAQQGTFPIPEGPGPAVPWPIF